MLLPLYSPYLCDRMEGDGSAFSSFACPNPVNCRLVLAAPVVCGCMLSPVRSSKLPAVKHRHLCHRPPEERISSGGPYLAAHVYHIIYTAHMLVIPLFTHENGRASLTAGATAHGRLILAWAITGHHGPSLAIAARIVRQIEPAREAVGSVRAVVMHPAREVRAR